MNKKAKSDMKGDFKNAMDNILTPREDNDEDDILAELKKLQDLSVDLRRRKLSQLLVTASMNPKASKIKNKTAKLLAK